MRHWKRLFYYLMINVLVSACTILAVLAAWNRIHPPAAGSTQAAETAQAQAQVTGALAEATDTGLQVKKGSSQEGLEPASQVVVDSPTQEAASASDALTLTYQVKSGDTLGAIATEFGVSVEEILAVNDLTDPNRLDVGQTLIIPPTESSQAEAEPTATSAPKPTKTTKATTQPASTPPPVEGEAQVEIDSVIGAGDLSAERVYLKRTGAGEISLEGWQILDQQGNLYTFPKFKLFEDGAVYLYTRAGQSTSVELYWGLDQPVWQTGETVVLLDDQGKVRATYVVP